MSEELLSRVKRILDEKSSEKKIDLSNEGLMDGDILKIVDLLQRSDKKVKLLNLYRNNIGDKGAQVLATLTNVREIDLSSNRVKDEGLKSLIVNAKIKELTLSDNPISDNCAAFVRENIQQIYVCLEKTKIQRENISKIEEVTRRNKQSYKSPARSPTLGTLLSGAVSFFEESAAVPPVVEKNLQPPQSAKALQELTKHVLEKHPELPRNMEAVFAKFLVVVLEEAPNFSLRSEFGGMKGAKETETPDKLSSNLSELHKTTKLK